MQLDIVIATHNRAQHLKRLLDSLQAADRPPALAVRVIVVDNASTDATPEVVRSYGAVCGMPPVSLFEPTLGKSFALNRGIRSLTGDLVGFLDDDERVEPGWLSAAFTVFQEPGVDFISGPYKPDWGAAPPAWLPRGYRAVIGWIDPGDRVMRYGVDFDGVMMGGNAVVRRDWVDRVGFFTIGLGGRGATPLSGEDVDYFQRLLALGARGYYIPDLVINHYIQPGRLTKRYHRRWVFCHGLCRGRIDRLRPQKVVYRLGIPRYLLGTAARAAFALARSVSRREIDPEQTFTHELQLWELVGFACGRHLLRPLAIPALP